FLPRVLSRPHRARGRAAPGAHRSLGSEGTVDRSEGIAHAAARGHVLGPRPPAQGDGPRGRGRPRAVADLADGLLGRRRPRPAPGRRRERRDERGAPRLPRPLRRLRHAADAGSRARPHRAAACGRPARHPRRLPRHEHQRPRAVRPVVHAHLRGLRGQATAGAAAPAHRDRRREPPGALLPQQLPWQPVRHRHRRRAPGLRRRARPVSEAGGLPAARRRCDALSRRPAHARPEGAAGDEGRGQAPLRRLPPALHVRHDQSRAGITAVPRRPRRRGPRDDRQRLLFRHGPGAAARDRGARPQAVRAGPCPHPVGERAAPARSVTAEFWVTQTFNGVSYGALLFLLASGLSLIFGVMRVVNLAHGSYFMLGGYVGLSVVWRTGSYVLALAAGALVLAVVAGAALWLALDRTRVGAMIRAAVDDPEMAQGIGIRVPRISLGVFGLGAALAAFGGVVGAGFLGVYPGLDFEILPYAFVVVIV